MIHACWASQIILTALGIPCVVFVQFTKWITFKFPRASVYKKTRGLHWMDTKCESPNIMDCNAMLVVLLNDFDSSSLKNDKSLYISIKFLRSR